MRILLVDDEVDFVVTLAERLSFRGIESDWTAKPEDAIEKAKLRNYELAVLDVKMPKVSGINLKKRLQEIYPEMKFIFLTGHGSEESYLAGTREAGVDYYLLKPVQIEELVDKIRTAVTGEGEDRDER
jgi:DNA-binding response OmpR family regulator